MSRHPEANTAAFLDAVVNDRDAALAMLAGDPQLISARWIHGGSLLHFLAVEGFDDGVTFLAENGAEIDATNEFGDTALIDAVVLGNRAIVELLLRRGANPDAKSLTRDNPLHIASSIGDACLVELLLSAGANANYVTDLGESVFDALPRKGKGRAEIVQLLRHHGVVGGSRDSPE